MIDWLFATCIFWTVAAVFYGGIYDAETGSPGRQALGLLLNMVAFLAVFGLVNFALRGVGGDSGFMRMVWGIIVPAALPTMLLGRIGNVVFRLVGVRMARKAFSADAH